MPEDKKTQMKIVKVAKVVDESTVVLNAGANDGVRMGQRFLIYEIGAEIIDPDTKVGLGKLETVRGTGTVAYLQPMIATVKSDMKEANPSRIVRRSSPSMVLRLYGQEEEVVETQSAHSVPFASPKVGDIAKPV